jgi:hypothetical protein
MPFHDVCCLIQSHYELGIVPVFWDDEPVESGPAGPSSALTSHDFAEMMAWI